MKKYISRTRSRLTFILIIISVIFAVIGAISENKILIFVAAVLYIADLVLMIVTNQCPYCGEFFRGIYWSKPDAGYCRKCGKLIEFDDCNEDNEL